MSSTAPLQLPPEQTAFKEKGVGGERVVPCHKVLSLRLQPHGPSHEDRSHAHESMIATAGPYMCLQDPHLYQVHTYLLAYPSACADAGDMQKERLEHGLGLSDRAREREWDGQEPAVSTEI